MPRASRDPEHSHGRVIEMLASPQATRTDTARRSRRGRRVATPHDRPILLPAWPTADTTAQARSARGETRGALALLDDPKTIAERAPATAHRRILVVEDDELMTNLIRAGLELDGERDWEVQSAGEGVRALELAGAAPPDVVLLDVRLPGLDGAEVYRQLRAGAHTRHARILFLSAGTSYDLHLRGIEDGVLLRKPFDVGELVGLVRSLMAG